MHVAVVGALALVLSACWPAPGQGPNRTGHNPHENAINPGNVATLAEKWSASDPRADFLGTAPVVSGGTVYVTTRADDGSGNFPILLNAYRVADGSQVFSSPLVNFPVFPNFSAPWVLGDDRVAAGWEYGQRRPVIVEHDAPSVDVATGEPTGSVGTGPIEAVRGDVVVSTATYPSGATDDTRSLQVKHLDDESQDWGARLQRSPCVDSIDMTLGTERLYQAGCGADSVTPGPGAYNRAVRAFPLTGGQTGCGPDGDGAACPLWVTPMQGSLTPPVIRPDQSTVYVVANNDNASTVHALDATTGAIQWSGALDVYAGTPALAEDNLYVPTADGRVVVFAGSGCGAATCSPLWEAATGTGSSVRDAQLAVAGGVLFTASADGAVHAFDAAGCGTGPCAPLWSASPNTTAATALAVTGGRLFVRSYDGELTVYGLPA